MKRTLAGNKGYFGYGIGFIKFRKVSWVGLVERLPKNSERAWKKLESTQTDTNMDSGPEAGSTKVGTGGQGL